MSRQNDIKSGFSALLKHHEAIDLACLENGGLIPDIEDNNDVIQALTKRNLGYYAHNSLDVQVHGSVRKLVNHIGKRYNLRKNHAEFAGLIDKLKYSVDMYHNATKRSRFAEDGAQYLNEVREIVFDIQDELTHTIASFSDRIANGFSTIADINLRITESKRCGEEVTLLTQLFSSVQVKDIDLLVNYDEALEILLNQELKTHIDKSLIELKEVAKQVLILSAKLVEERIDEEHNTLIDSFYTYYEQYPTFSPDINHMQHIPTCFCMTEKQTLFATADINDVLHQDALEDIAIQIHSEHDTPKPVKEFEKVEVKAQTERHTTEEIDLFEQNIEYVFEALLNTGSDIQKLRGSELFDVLNIAELNESKDDWLLGLIVHYDTQAFAIAKQLKMEVLGYQEPLFDGNYHVNEVVFERINA